LQPSRQPLRKPSKQPVRDSPSIQPSSQPIRYVISNYVVPIICLIFENKKLNLTACK
jgi:hypothetical protein